MTIDINGMFFFLGMLSFCLMVLGLAAIYFGFSFKRGSEEFSVTSGRYEKEKLEKERREYELQKEMEVPDLELEEEAIDDQEFNRKNKKNI